MGSKITLIFNSLPNINELSNFTETSLGLNFLETFKAQRLTYKQVRISYYMSIYELTFLDTENLSGLGISYNHNGDWRTISLNDVAKRNNYNGTLSVILEAVYTPQIIDLNTNTAITWSGGEFVYVEDSVGTSSISSNYVNAFNLDYNLNNLFSVEAFPALDSLDMGSVTIEANYPNAVFVEGTTTADITYIIENVVEEIITISDVTFSEATTNPKCTHYKASITTNKIIDKVTVNGVVIVTGNMVNPVEFEVQRGQSLAVILEDDIGTVLNYNRSINQVPPRLNESNFDFTVNYSPAGSSIVITPKVDVSTLVLEYSLNGSSWQSANTFPSLLEGDYNVYVRDNFGCQFNTTLEISDSGQRTPYFLMPKANSIRFANRVTWGDCANYKNEDNTLSCESEVLKPFEHVILLQSCDVITTQFRSEYTQNSAFVIDGENTTPIAVSKMTSNIGVKDMRDARRYNLGNSRTGIYFISGNKYDYDNETITGTYSLNGLLPEWGQLGNYVQIGTEWFLIENVVFDEINNADVLVINSAYTGSDEPIIVSSVYSREDFEEYEFTIDFFNYLNKTVRVSLELRDSNFAPINQLSEKINVKIRHEDTVEIKYKNSTNTDINWSRGLECKMRLPYIRIDGQILDETENYKTDSTAILLRSEIYYLDEFTLEPLVLQIMRQLAIAVSHDTVKINDVGYVKNDSVAVEGALGESNLYAVTINMLRTGNAYSSNLGGGGFYGGEDVEIPGLVDHGSGYIKYN